MSSSQHISGLMAEIVSLLPLQEIRELADGDCWVLDLDDGRAIVAEYLAGDDRLFLSAEVGLPPPDAREQCYGLLLAYNAMWRETGGIRMAVDGEEGMVIQICDVGAADLDVETMCALLDNFVGKLGGWMEIVAAEPDDDTAERPTEIGIGVVRV